MSANDFVESHFDEFLSDLNRLLAQPSISATGEGVLECTDLASELCQAYCFDETFLVETDGQPAILAHAYVDGDPENGAPTILIYGHYDVQPVTPELWTSPPFQPTIRQGPNGNKRLYARGAGDNKGQWFAHLCAIRVLRETDNLQMNIALLLEGEEESGSPHLSEVVSRLADDLDVELAYVADGPIDPSGRPHVLLGARGMLYVQVDAIGPNRDLHSGNYGGPVPNPAWELVRIVSSMKDTTGQVTIDGFYESVREITALDREVLKQMPFDAEAVTADLDVGGFVQGPGDSYLEKLLYWPTLNIAGFTSGYGGKGTKTIIPSTAQVKMDMRLVADQGPNDLYEKFVRHIKDHESGTVDIEVSKLGTMKPQRTPLDHEVIEPVMAAVREGWGTEPILKPTLGGSLPTYVFTEELGIPCITVPYANSDENNHSPDENIALDCFENGIRTTMCVLNRLTAHYMDP